MSIHPLLQKKFIDETPDNIVLYGLKFTYKHLEVYDSMFVTDSSLLPVAKELEHKKPEELDSIESKTKLAKSLLDHQQKIVKGQVIALNDMPHTLTDEEIEILPQHVITELCNCILRVDVEATERLRRFLIPNGGSETSEPDDGDLHPGGQIWDSAVEANSTELDVQQNANGN